jgi:hypothetical protein
VASSIFSRINTKTLLREKVTENGPMYAETHGEMRQKGSWSLCADPGVFIIARLVQNRMA